MKRFHIKVNGNAYDVEVEEVGGAAAAPAPATVPAASAPAPAAAPAANVPAAPVAAAPAASAPAGAETINAPMPGNILGIHVKTGDQVTKGQVLLVLEAMKMENEIMAPADGTVSQVYAAEGAAVNTGDPLIAL